MADGSFDRSPESGFVFLVRFSLMTLPGGVTRQPVKTDKLAVLVTDGVNVDTAYPSLSYPIASPQ